MSALGGLDLSTRCAAIVAVPLNWGGDFSRVTTKAIGLALGSEADENARAQRNAEIARVLVEFAVRHECREAWFESYAFAKFGGHAYSHLLAELGGVVKLELLRAGVGLRIANMGSARKLLLGKLPATKTPEGRRIKDAAKRKVVEVLAAAGVSFRTVDEAEAFVAANFGLYRGAGSFFALPEPPKEKRAKPAGSPFTGRLRIERSGYDPRGPRIIDPTLEVEAGTKGIPW